MKDLQKLFKECIEEMDAIGIKYGNITSIISNKRLTRTWGTCHKKSHPSGKWEDFLFEIKISARLLTDNVDDNAIKSTIIHEILHTCKGCMNHGANWKREASKVNRVYPQYNIKRATSSSEKGIEEETEYKYIVYCPSCKRERKYRRKTEFVRNCTRFTCNCCHISLKLKDLT